MTHVYNFSAGPAMLPREVLREAAEELCDYKGSGISVMEMSHRSKMYEEIQAEAEQDLRTLLHIPPDYEVLFLQGGASQQFAMIPMNFLKQGTADYIITGHWSQKAFLEAKHFGKARVIASGEADGFSSIPDCSQLPISEHTDYVYICENNTIYGTKFKTLPDTKGRPLISDASSCLLSEPVDINRYGMLYGSVQKNIGPAGVVIAIIRKDLLLETNQSYIPAMLRYKTHAEHHSLYNTPPCYNIYICGKVLKWLLSMGGLRQIQLKNEQKAKLLYDYIDQSRLYKGTAEKKDRSLMNVTFVTKNPEMDQKFAANANACRLINLKGHRSHGGIRASIYNAMPIEGIEALIRFMEKFEAENKK